ncbi:NlpC/P60 family protein [Paraclostridium bifermentans]|uniref:NlpC/P60 family protein n=1 Tax=Paraclostridium bifermentans TaxID=1490 RepID=UPI00374E4026
MILQPRGAKPFSAETIKEDPGTVAGNDASVNAGFNNGKPTPAGNSLIQACSLMQEQGINPSSLSKERLAVFYEGRKWFGSWYAWGGKTPPKKNSDGSWQTPHRTGGVVGGYALAGPGFDCSGYVGYIFKQVFKVNMGSGSYEQGHSKYAKLIDVNQAKPGDIYWHSGHIAIFVKHDAKYIYVMQSPQTGEKIGWGKFSKRTPYRITRPTFYKD